MLRPPRFSVLRPESVLSCSGANSGLLEPCLWASGCWSHCQPLRAACLALRPVPFAPFFSLLFPPLDSPSFWLTANSTAAGPILPIHAIAPLPSRRPQKGRVSDLLLLQLMADLIARWMDGWMDGWVTNGVPQLNFRAPMSSLDGDARPGSRRQPQANLTLILQEPTLTETNSKCLTPLPAGDCEAKRP